MSNGTSADKTIRALKDAGWFVEEKRAGLAYHVWIRRPSLFAWAMTREEAIQNVVCKIYEERITRVE